MKTSQLTFSACIVCALLFCASLAQGQSVTINSVSGTSFCPGDSISVSFTATGFWGHRNAFTLQLSDGTGSFSNFQNIGSIIDTLPGTFTIKALTLGNGGLHYRVRILAAIPYTTSADNGSDITIWYKPYVYLSSSITVGSVGTPITFANWIGEDTILWDFGAGAIPAEAISAGIITTDFNPITQKNETGVSFPPVNVTYSTPGDKVITLTDVNPGGCSTTVMYELYIYDCSNPTIPHDAIVINSDTTLMGSGVTYWINPGFTVLLQGDNDTIFVEPGSTISRASNYDILYMKPGSVLTSSESDNRVIFGDGANINSTKGDFTLHCPTLDFDYANAPPNKAFPTQGVKDDAALAQITLSPNPTTGMLRVQGLSSHNISVSVINILGEMVMEQKNPPASDFTLDLSKLVPGTYYIRFSSANSVVTKKVVRE